MSTEAELLASALRHMKSATISHDEYLRRIQTQRGYPYTKTAHYRAAIDLEKAAKASAPTPPTPPPPPIPKPGNLQAARARMFLAQEPLACLAAPTFMVPVCTADPSYRAYYTPDTIRQLRARFGRVESWCDCHTTFYDAALAMQRELGLDGAWGECESRPAFDRGYADGARRFVGSIDVSVLDDERLAKVAAGEVLLTVELYRNVQPGMQPNWRNANAGVGGNCIAVYGSSSEGAKYTPVSAYKALGLYVAQHDSVYAVGLTPDDWRELWT